MTATSSPATVAVFNTTELCELILLKLPFVDLLRAREVNKLFQNVIQGSTLLLLKLFLIPTNLHRRTPNKSFARHLQRVIMWESSCDGETRSKFRKRLSDMDTAGNLRIAGVIMQAKSWCLIE